MLKSLEVLASQAADALLAHPWKLWFWGDSIGLEGLLDASEISHNPAYQHYVYGLLKGWIARENHRSSFDYTAPGVALLRVWELVRDPALLAAAHRHAEYMEGFRKTDAGAFLRYEHAAIELPPELPGNHPDFDRTEEKAKRVSDGGPCVFVDSVHFDGPFFSKLYQVTGEDRYRSLALQNILPQIELLFDSEARLFHHFWIERSKSRNGVLWGRGNGWGLLGVVRTLEHLPGEDPGAVKLKVVLCAHAERLAELQDDGGGWHTVLDDPASYIETSIAAFVVDGFSTAINRGWLSSDKFQVVIDRAFDFLLANVSDTGVLKGVSYETFPSTRAEHYRKMPRNAVVPWGQGPLLGAIRAYRELKQ
jgi:unsaturated rhamnogalacturonyl hydrolase